MPGVSSLAKGASCQCTAGPIVPSHQNRAADHADACPGQTCQLFYHSGPRTRARRFLVNWTFQTAPSELLGYYPRKTSILGSVPDLAPRLESPILGQYTQCNNPRRDPLG